MCKNVNVIFQNSSVDVSKEVDFVFSIANKLRGAYKPDKYKDVIIPMLIIRRFECALEDTKDMVLKAIETSEEPIPVKRLEKIAGKKFYNTSKYTLKRLLDDSDNIVVNFENYILGFSSNVQEILNNLDFNKQIAKLDKTNRLYNIIKSFSEFDLSMSHVDNIKMGYMFEDIIRRFSENAEAGDHYTPREVIQLLVNLLLAEGSNDWCLPGKVVTACDMACGTGGMLSLVEYFLRQLNPDVKIKLYGQEVNPESYAICLADMLIKGENADNIRYQDSMKADCFSGQKMRLMIENPPFGAPWGGKDAAEGVEKAVKDEYKKGFDGRFGAGLPGTEDMQLLFMQDAVNKLTDDGRAAIITNGSPLFKGGTTSGESQIRRWLLENDYIEAIIALPTDLFYNTNIGIYVFILSKSKQEKRKGKVQLINCVDFYSPLRRSLGKKRKEITKENISEIVKLYTEFKEGEYCKIFDNNEFMYKEYSVYQPLQRNYCISEDRIQNLIDKKYLSSLFDVDKFEELSLMNPRPVKEEEVYQKNLKALPLYNELIACLSENTSDVIYKNKVDFLNTLAPIIDKILDIDLKLKENNKKKVDIINKIADGLSIMDKTADIQYSGKGAKKKVELDKETKDIEIVKLTKDVDEYMKEEVYPHIPDAVYVYDYDANKKGSKEKIGAEIPFTKYFYKFEEPESSDILLQKFNSLHQSSLVNINNLGGIINDLQ